ncbi:PREDICTED: aminoacylase-1-like [Papilio polytes]|uniref:aminoacylase-1-like n=1 Tax=Papilio polytes TaxID=76194 RepID=UPI000676845C|nr:PREDICTED: aminoacylase-1-like [Papilio polytes]
MPGLKQYSRMISLYLLILFNLTFSNPIPKEYVIQKLMNDSTVKLLQEYIRIDTSREENVESAVLFWKRQADALNLPFAVHRPAKKPICVITWTGCNPKLPSIILNSHTDVVTVAKQEWTHEPFSGYIDENGDLYGRGAQDTKALSITYIEAIRTLIEEGVKLQRTIHVLLMPDEETGGFNGMIPFVETEEFRALNPGFFFDEGLSSPDGKLYATYQDKRPWQLNVTLHGKSGHGSTITEDSAMEKLQRLLDITREFRRQQKKIMSSKEPTDYGSYSTLNVNIINGGVATNIIPSNVNLVIDMRLATSAQVSDVNAMIQSWIEQVGNDTEVSFIRKIEVSERTILDGSNPYWVALVSALRDMDLQIEPIVCPATSDMVVVRNKGFPAIGFAYRPYTVPRIHAADEYINIAIFQQGIRVYANILKRVANLT